MADRTKIEWTDATLNPIRARRIIRSADGSEPDESRIGSHCEHVSEACRNCYAEAINRRFGTGLDYKPGHLASRGGEVEIFFDDRPIREMMKWRRPKRIFVCSTTDLFADFVPDWMIDLVFAAAALRPLHTFQLLTKRPERMRAYLTDPRTPERIAIEMLKHVAAWGAAGAAALAALGDRKHEEDPEYVPLPLPNVWLGVTAERQLEADERIPVILETPAAKRFVSIEPMLGQIGLRHQWRRGGYDDWLAGERWFPGAGSIDSETVRGGPRLDWVICGGDARPMHPDWARSLRDQCAAAGVPFFFKQWGEWAPWGPRPGGMLGEEIRAGKVMAVHPSGRTTHELADETGGKCTERGSRYMARLGKLASGHLLDGVEHHAFPEG